MFPKMRRYKQLLSEAECIAILEKGSCGVLALTGENGYPYALPLSYVYHEGKIIFHGATEGYKVQCLRHCDKASFCVVDQDEVIAEKYTTHYRSVIAFGKVKMLTDFGEEMIRHMMPLAAKYRPEGTDAMHRTAIDNEKTGLCVLVMEIEHLTGKQAIELCK